MSRVLNRLAEWKRASLYALVQVRTASAALNLRDYQAFSRVFAGSAGGFSDPTRLTRWTRGFLWAHVAIVAIRLSIRALERVGGTVELSPVVWGLWVAVQLLAVYGTVILVPLWTRRANHNAGQLGAAEMTFTPSWAAGWYFLPPGLLWKPYLVMKEIWQVSVDPGDWRSQRGSPLLDWWWALWLIAVWGELLVFAVARLALEPGDAQTVEGAMGLANQLLHLPLTLILLTIITKIHDMQMVHYRNQSEEAST